jgi:hypothetical protein
MHDRGLTVPQYEGKKKLKALFSQRRESNLAHFLIIHFDIILRAQSYLILGWLKSVEPRKMLMLL